MTITEMVPATERAMQYARTNSRPGTGDRHKYRLAMAWLDGYHGKPSPYDHGRGGNFARPLRQAHRDGQVAATDASLGIR